MQFCLTIRMRYSVRKLFVVVATISLLFGLLHAFRRQLIVVGEREQIVVSQLVAQGGSVEYVQIGPSWLNGWIDKKLALTRVDAVAIPSTSDGSRDYTDLCIELLNGFYWLREVDVYGTVHIDGCPSSISQLDTNRLSEALPNVVIEITLD